MKNLTASSMGIRMEIRVEEPVSIAQYTVVPEEGYAPELGVYRTYGIQTTTADHVEILHDVSVNECVVMHIVERINRCQLSPLHLYDFVLDTLS